MCEPFTKMNRTRRSSSEQVAQYQVSIVGCGVLRPFCGIPGRADPAVDRLWKFSNFMDVTVVGPSRVRPLQA